MSEKIQLSSQTYSSDISLGLRPGNLFSSTQLSDVQELHKILKIFLAVFLNILKMLIWLAAKKRGKVYILLVEKLRIRDCSVVI